MDAIFGTTKQQLHRQVCGELAQLINTFRLASAGGDYGINNAAEDFFCGFLNIVLDQEFPGINLQNMNALRANYPSIDLGDISRKVAVQVTTTENRAKITHTLDKFFENNLDSTFQRLIILVIGKKDPMKKAFAVQRNFNFDASRDIWDIDRLGAILGTLTEETLSRIIQYFAKELHKEKVTAPVPNYDVEYFNGMVKMLEEMQKTLELIKNNSYKQPEKNETWNVTINNNGNNNSFAPVINNNNNSSPVNTITINGSEQGGKEKAGRSFWKRFRKK